MQQPQPKVGKFCPKCSLQASEELLTCPNDGTPLNRSVIVTPTSNLAGQYEFIAKIGEGGMGVIYKARHLALNNLVAIKMMHINRLDRDVILRFQQEAKAVSALDHPSIVRVRDFGISETGQPHIVLDYIDGVTLENVLKDHGPLSLSDARDTFSQICDAVGHAHQRNILHRDLKPSNIMLVYRENDCPLVKIVDFGIAKELIEGKEGINLTKAGEVVGSPFYMSPEQASGRTVDKRSDLYAVGCVLFEALTGAPPFVGQNAIETMIKQTSEAVPTLREGSLGKSFPPELQAVIDKALAKDPSQRFQTMNEFKTALVDSIEGIESSTYQSRQIPPIAKKKLPFSRIAIFTVLFLGCAGIALLIASWKTQPGKTALEKNQNDSLPIKSIESDKSRLKTESNMLSELPDFNEFARSLIIGHKQDEAIIINVPCDDKALVAFDEVHKANQVELLKTNIVGSGLEHLIHLPLKHLSLEGSASFGTDGIVAIEMMNELVDLDLDGTAISDSNLQSLSALRYLTSLSLARTEITSRGLRYLRGLRRLEDLSLSGCVSIGDRDMSELCKLKHIKVLDLSNLNMTDLGLRVLTNAYFAEGLRELSLGDTPISHDGLRILRAFGALRKLSLANSKAGHLDLLALAKSSPAIEDLNFSNCSNITDQDLKILQSFKSLKALDLSRTSVSDEGLKYLLPLPLRELNLAHTRLTDKGLLMLAELKGLRKIDLTSSLNVSWNGANAFHTRLPNCKLTPSIVRQSSSDAIIPLAH
jgi:serine/threonine protein kinase